MPENSPAILPSLGEEECIPLVVFPLHLGQILFGFVFFPDTGRKYVLIPLVPPSINDLGQSWVFVKTLKFFVWERRGLVLVLPRSL